jgi:hypothetical protein
MSVLIVGEAERARIKEVIAFARANPVPMSKIKEGKLDHTNVLKLEDRPPGFERPASAHVDFPGGYRAAFSIEEQPAGFCTHLSVGVEGRAQKGMLPSMPAVRMICEEFGVPFPPDHGWTEEYEPGEYAVNLVSLYAPTKEGNA